MTVGELRSKLKDVPDDVPIVVIDHYGDPMEVPSYDWEYSSIHNCSGMFFVIPEVDIGEAPD